MKGPVCLLLLPIAVSLSSCGYHVGGQADLVPKSVQTISIPAFSTLTTRYKLVDQLPQEIGREFMARSRFRIVNNPAEADAVLNGSINTVTMYPTVSDPTSGAATSVQVAVSLTLRLVERTTGRVLYSRVNMIARDNYEMAIDPHQFFDERDPAFARLSHNVAHDVVSGILEDF